MLDVNYIDCHQRIKSNFTRRYVFRDESKDIDFKSIGQKTLNKLNTLSRNIKVIYYYLILKKIINFDNKGSMG